MRKRTSGLWIPRSDVLPLRNRLHGERGLLRSSYDVRLAYCAYVLYDVRESFELGKGIEKYVFRLVTSVGQRKHSESP